MLRGGDTLAQPLEAPPAPGPREAAKGSDILGCEHTALVSNLRRLDGRGQGLRTDDEDSP